MSSKRSTHQSNGQRDGQISAAVYYRCSDARQEKSIADQARDVEKWCAANGIRIAARYQDEGISGDKTERRAGFLAMREAAIRGEFQAIVVWDWNRLGRFDPMEMGYWLHPVRQAGVRLFTTDRGERDWNDPTGQVINSVEATGAKEYLVKHSRAVARAMLREAEAGNWVWPAPLGYRLNNVIHRLEINDEEAAIVREIFERYARGGWSIRRIVSDFNTRKVPTMGKMRRGVDSRWRIDTVHSILTNRVYVGETHWNKVTKASYHKVVRGVKDFEVVPARKGKRTPTDKANHIPIKTPRLIDDATFNLVQRTLADKRREGHREGSPHPTTVFLLSGLLECSLCGNRLYGQRRWPKVRYHCPGCNLLHRHPEQPGVTKRKCRCGAAFPVREGTPDAGTVVYRCDGGKRYGVCSSRAVDEVDLIHGLQEPLSELIGKPERWRGEVVRLLRAAARTDPTQLKKLKTSIAKLDREIEEGTDRWLKVPKNLMEGVRKTLDAWIERKEFLTQELKRLEEARDVVGDVDAVAEQVVCGLGRLFLHLINPEDPDAARAALRRTFEKVIVGYMPPEYRSACSAAVISFKFKPNAFAVRNLLPSYVDCVNHPPYQDGKGKRGKEGVRGRGTGPGPSLERPLGFRRRATRRRGPCPGRRRPSPPTAGRGRAGPCR
jgi:DNA invertase Pin-like site-specific DNA recombinase